MSVLKLTYIRDFCSFCEGVSRPLLATKFPFFIILLTQAVLPDQFCFLLKSRTWYYRAVPEAFIMESTSLMILPPTLLFANPVENSTKHTHVGLTPEEGTALCSEVTAWFLPPLPFLFPNACYLRVQKTSLSGWMNQIRIFALQISSITAGGIRSLPTKCIFKHLRYW